MIKMNKKGFTLIELLAVIIVLAIIMVIAVPTVLDRMDAAKKSAFKIYAQKVLNTAITKYETDTLTNTLPDSSTEGTQTVYCYDLPTLNLGKGTYKGFAKIKIETDNKVTYHVTMKDGSFNVADAEYDDLEDGTNITTGSGTVGEDPKCTP